MEKQIRELIKTMPPGVYTLRTLGINNADRMEAMAIDYSPSTVKKYTNKHQTRTIFYLFNRHGLTSQNMPAYQQSIADEIARHAERLSFQFDDCYSLTVTDCEYEMMEVVETFDSDVYPNNFQLSLKINKQGNKLTKQIVARAVDTTSAYIISYCQVHFNNVQKKQYKNCVTVSILDACKQLVYDKYEVADKTPSYHDILGTIYWFIHHRSGIAMSDLGLPDSPLYDIDTNVMNAIVAFVLADYVGISN